MADSFLSSVGQSLLDRLFVHGTVRASEPITRRMRKIRIHAEALTTAPYAPGQQVRIQVGEVFGRDLLRGDTLRAYSIWDHHRARAELELCVLDHPEAGPGARWGHSVAAGAPVSFRPPEGKFVMQVHSGTHFLVGDETASVALGAIARALPATAKLAGAIETEGEDERLPMPNKAALTWVVRGTRPNADPAALVQAVRRAAHGIGSNEPRTAYLAGEARTCKAARAALLDLGWSSREILVKPFWMPGKKGLE